MKRATNFGAMIAIAVVLTLLGAGCEPSLLLDDIEEVVRAYGGQPGILIVQDGRNVDSGSGTHSFGPTEVGSTSEALFSIRNVGTEALILTGDPDYVQISGTDAADFSVMGNQPGSPVTDETTFVLGFSPSSLGSKSATVSIPNNDPDASQSPYVFSVTGAGVLAGSVATPNGGEAYRPGTNCEITWGVFEGAANVRIELLKAGLLDTTIANSTLDDGSYTWAIPSGQTGGNDYTVRITGVENPTLVDESDAAFAVGALEVLSPNGGDVLAKSGDLDITWDTGGLGGFVSIELHRDGSWAADIVASTENDGSYLNWPVPVSTTVADGYTIVIETVTPGSTVADQSDAGFAIEQIVVTRAKWWGRALHAGWIDHGHLGFQWVRDVHDPARPLWNEDDAHDQRDQRHRYVHHDGAGDHTEHAVQGCCHEQRQRSDCGHERQLLRNRHDLGGVSERWLLRGWQRYHDWLVEYTGRDGEARADGRCLGRANDHREHG